VRAVLFVLINKHAKGYSIMPDLTVVQGGKKSDEELNLEYAQRRGISELNKLQRELGLEIDEVHSLRARHRVLHTMLHLIEVHGSETAARLLRQELEYLEGLL